MVQDSTLLRPGQMGYLFHLGAVPHSTFSFHFLGLSSKCSNYPLGAWNNPHESESVFLPLEVLSNTLTHWLGQPDVLRSSGIYEYVVRSWALNRLALVPEVSLMSGLLSMTRKVFLSQFWLWMICQGVADILIWAVSSCLCRQRSWPKKKKMCFPFFSADIHCRYTLCTRYSSRLMFLPVPI